MLRNRYRLIDMPEQYQLKKFPMLLRFEVFVEVIGLRFKYTTIVLRNLHPLSPNHTFEILKG